MNLKQLTSGVGRLVGILTLVAAVMSGILGGVNAVTEDRIDALTLEKTNAALMEVLPTTGGYQALEGVAGSNGVQAVWKCDAGHAVQVKVSGAQSSLVLIVGVGNDQTCTGVSIISHGETPGLGAKATEADWRAQFVGAGSGVAVTKDGGAINALTGATITSRAVSGAVNTAIDTVAALG